VGCLHTTQGSRAAAHEPAQTCAAVLGTYHRLVTVTDPAPARGALVYSTTQPHVPHTQSHIHVSKPRHSSYDEARPAPDAVLG